MVIIDFNRHRKKEIWNTTQLRSFMLNAEYRFVQDLKDKKESWNLICHKFNEEFLMELKPTTLQKRYEREIGAQDAVAGNDIDKAVRMIKSEPLKPTELARRLYLDLDGLEDLLDDIFNSRAAIKMHNGLLVFDRTHTSPDDKRHKMDVSLEEGVWHKIGIIADTHLCGTHELPHLLEKFYSICQEEGVIAMLHAGDVSCGGGSVYKGQLQDIKVLGVDKQINYMASIYPMYPFPTYMINGNHDCLDSTTTVLTKQGWTTWEDISKEDEVLGINTETGLSEWQPILDIIQKPSTEIYRFESQQLSLATTAKHRNLHLKKGKYEYILTEDIKSHPPMVPLTSCVANPEYLIPDDEIKLVGWLLTDGYAKYHRGGNPTYSISQSEGDTAVEIEEMLKRLGVNYGKYARTRENVTILGKKVKRIKESYEFNLHREYSDYIRNNLLPENKVLPAWIFELSTRQLDVFIDTLIKADGCKYPSKKCWILYGEEYMLDQFHPLFNMCGYSCNKTQDNRGHWRLNISKSPSAGIGHYKHRIQKQSYEGLVHCLTVPLSNFLVCRNGKSYFTGNCDYLKQAGVDIIEKLCMVRPDITYVGKLGGYVDIDGISCYLLHGDAGNPTARTFKMQKLIDNMPTEALPDIYVLGHYHVVSHLPNYRGVIGVQPACFESQGDFLLRKGLYAEVGGCILNVMVADTDKGKRIVRHQLEFFDLSHYI